MPSQPARAPSACAISRHVTSRAARAASAQTTACARSGARRISSTRAGTAAWTGTPPTRRPGADPELVLTDARGRRAGSGVPPLGQRDRPESGVVGRPPVEEVRTPHPQRAPAGDDAARAPGGGRTRPRAARAAWGPPTTGTYQPWDVRRHRPPRAAPRVGPRRPEGSRRTGSTTGSGGRQAGSSSSSMTSTLAEDRAGRAAARRTWGQRCGLPQVRGKAHCGPARVESPVGPDAWEKHRRGHAAGCFSHASAADGRGRRGARRGPGSAAAAGLRDEPLLEVQAGVALVVDAAPGPGAVGVEDPGGGPGVERGVEQAPDLVDATPDPVRRPAPPRDGRGCGA